MMDSSQAGADLGFDYESPEDVAAAVLTGISHGQTHVVRGGPARNAMVTANLEDPDALDQTLADRKPALEHAVAGHSSL